MRLLLILSILFFGGVCYNISISNYYEAMVGIAFAGVLFGLYLYFRIERKKAEAFVRWIITNKNQINMDGIEYNGYIIDSKTELVQYQTCISFIVFSVKISSRLFIKESLAANIAKIIYTLAALILGWWGLPWGPIYTIQIIYNNLSERIKIQVGNVCNLDIAS